MLLLSKARKSLENMLYRRRITCRTGSGTMITLRRHGAHSRNLVAGIHGVAHQLGFRQELPSGPLRGGGIRLLPHQGFPLFHIEAGKINNEYGFLGPQGNSPTMIFATPRRVIDFHVRTTVRRRVTDGTGGGIRRSADRHQERANQGAQFVNQFSSILVVIVGTQLGRDDFPYGGGTVAGGKILQNVTKRLFALVQPVQIFFELTSTFRLSHFGAQ